MQCGFCKGKTFGSDEALKAHAMSGYWNKNMNQCIDALPTMLKDAAYKEIKATEEYYGDKASTGYGPATASAGSGSTQTITQTQMKIMMHVNVSPGDTVHDLVCSIRDLVAGSFCVSDKDGDPVPLDADMKDVIEHGAGKGNSLWIEAAKTSGASSHRSKPY